MMQNDRSLEESESDKSLIKLIVRNKLPDNIDVVDPDISSKRVAMALLVDIVIDTYLDMDKIEKFLDAKWALMSFLTSPWGFEEQFAFIGSIIFNCLFEGLNHNREEQYALNQYFTALLIKIRAQKEVITFNQAIEIIINDLSIQLSLPVDTQTSLRNKINFLIEVLERDLTEEQKVIALEQYTKKYDERGVSFFLLKEEFRDKPLVQLAKLLSNG